MSVHFSVSSNKVNFNVVCVCNILYELINKQSIDWLLILTLNDFLRRFFFFVYFTNYLLYIFLSIFRKKHNYVESLKINFFKNQEIIYLLLFHKDMQHMVNFSTKPIQHTHRNFLWIIEKIHQSSNTSRSLV